MKKLIEILAHPATRTVLLALILAVSLQNQAKLRMIETLTDDLLMNTPSGASDADLSGVEKKLGSIDDRLSSIQGDAASGSYYLEQIYRYR